MADSFQISRNDSAMRQCGRSSFSHISSNRSSIYEAIYVIPSVAECDDLTLFWPFIVIFLQSAVVSALGLSTFIRPICKYLRSPFSALSYFLDPSYHKCHFFGVFNVLPEGQLCISSLCTAWVSSGITSDMPYLVRHHLTCIALSTAIPVFHSYLLQLCSSFHSHRPHFSSLRRREERFDYAGRRFLACTAFSGTRTTVWVLPSKSGSPFGLLEDIGCYRRAC